MEPLNSGLYPAEMVNNAGERLPKFSREQSLMVKGSLDFIGVNYYTANYAADVPCSSENQSLFSDACVILTSKTTIGEVYFCFQFDLSYVFHVCLLKILFVASAKRDGVQIGPKVKAYFGVTAKHTQLI